jgi:hypothetical protein
MHAVSTKNSESPRVIKLPVITASEPIPVSKNEMTSEICNRNGKEIIPIAYLNSGERSIAWKMVSKLNLPINCSATNKPENRMTLKTPKLVGNNMVKMVKAIVGHIKRRLLTDAFIRQVIGNVIRTAIKNVSTM